MDYLTHLTLNPIDIGAFLYCKELFNELIPIYEALSEADCSEVQKPADIPTLRIFPPLDIPVGKAANPYTLYLFFN